MKYEWIDGVYHVLCYRHEVQRIFFWNNIIAIHLKTFPFFFILSPSIVLEFGDHIEKYNWKENKLVIVYVNKIIIIIIWYEFLPY